MKRRTILGTAMMLLMLLVVTSSVATVRAEGPGDDNTAEIEDESEDEHEPDEYRDIDGSVWIQTDVMTARLNPDLPNFQYWYSDDNNGSLAKFSVSYLMVVEFEDLNGDDVYQPNETLAFAPLDAFEWTLQTGNISDDTGRNIEVYASYTKGGLSDEDYNDDWFEDWMPELGEDDDDSFFIADEEGDLDLSIFEGMTLQFYAHMYLNDYMGFVTDDQGIQANYTIQGGVELKVDIEIGNFPFESETSKIAILNYMKEDLASSDDSNYRIRLHEEEGDDDRDSEDIMGNLGEQFHDKEEDNYTQEISLVDSGTNTERGFYRWVDKAVVSLPNGTDYAVDVHASYWTDGKCLFVVPRIPEL
ncbi:MAG: hypothetical protein EAX95_02170 [Candidatus Thorarchaeota archaeon]|nr:hypothetical protein [Candidatus Thorarchaeota archaeon]